MSGYKELIGVKHITCKVLSLIFKKNEIKIDQLQKSLT